MQSHNFSQLGQPPSSSNQKQMDEATCNHIIWMLTPFSHLAEVAGGVENHTILCPSPQLHINTPAFIYTLFSIYPCSCPRSWPFLVLCIDEFSIMKVKKPSVWATFFQVFSIIQGKSMAKPSLLPLLWGYTKAIITLMSHTSKCGWVRAPGLTPSAPKQWKSDFMSRVATDEIQGKKIENAAI